MPSCNALLLRYDTGDDDNGLDSIYKMLTGPLGFMPDNVTVLAYNWNGTEGPTADRFKRNFLDLLNRAEPGDVVFVYTDVHGTQESDDTSGEDDGQDEGWIMAYEGNEDGSVTREIVYDDWVANTISTVGCFTFR